MPFLTAEEKQSLLDRYFDIEWCDDVSGLRCVHCYQVAIMPYLSNCQHIFCNNCKNIYSDEDLQTNCPQCQKFITQLVDQDFDVDVKIHQLKICCPNKKHGCNYADQLRRMPLHLMKCMSLGEPAFLDEKPETNALVDVVNQLANLNYIVGELNEGLREVKDKVDQLERKTDDTDTKINALTIEKQASQLASKNDTGELQSIKTQLESMNKDIQQIELHHQQMMEQMSLNMEEMRTKMASMTQEMETLKHKLKPCQRQSISPKAESYEWTIKDAQKRMLKKYSKYCIYDSGIFVLSRCKYHIKARIKRENGLSEIGLQFRDGHKVNEFSNNDGFFGTVKYIIRDQSNALQKKDILYKVYLQFNDGSGDHNWLFVNQMADEVFAPPYLVDDCLKITIILKPESIDHSFVSNNGILEWRVDNYRKRLEERLYSPIFSPSFYTSPTGYRVRVELEILDSQSINVMPYFLTGEHDGRLPLNFPRKTTLTLINQTDPSKNWVISQQCEELDYDIMGLSTTESMEESGFIKDDSFVLKVAIEPVASE